MMMRKILIQLDAEREHLDAESAYFRESLPHLSLLPKFGKVLKKGRMLQLMEAHQLAP